MKKKKKLFSLVLSALMGLTLTGCKQADQETPVTPAPDADQEIRDVIAAMTPQQKLSQMMIVALRSDGNNTETATEINQDYADLLKKYDFGGIILFTGNMTDTAQTVKLIHDIQEAAMSSETELPMFICVDQEGGMVNRVSFGTTSSGNMPWPRPAAPPLRRKAQRCWAMRSALLASTWISRWFPTSIPTLPTRSSACVPSRMIR